jgi:ethanolamine utilization protein EutQ
MPSHHFHSGNMPVKQYGATDSGVKIARAVHEDISTTLGGGWESFEDVYDTWTLTYDEVIFIHRGAIRMTVDGVVHDCKAGDILWMTKGSELIYDCKGGACEFFYALYPVNWAKIQGRKEP